MWEVIKNQIQILMKGVIKLFMRKRVIIGF